MSSKRNRPKSTSQSIYESPLESGVCIVRSSDGRPTIVYVEDFDGKSIAVKPSQGPYDRPLWILRSAVFHLDADLFTKLQRAYQNGTQEPLSALWQEARAWEPPT